MRQSKYIVLVFLQQEYLRKLFRDCNMSSLARKDIFASSLTNRDSESFVDTLDVITVRRKFWIFDREPYANFLEPRENLEDVEFSNYQRNSSLMREAFWHLIFAGNKSFNIATSFTMNVKYDKYI